MYTLIATRGTKGYSIEADKISVVIYPGVVLQNNSGSTNNCNQNTAETASPNRECLVFAGGQDYLWMEGELDSTSDGAGIGFHFVDSDFLRIRGAKSTKASLNLLFANSANARVEDFVGIDGGSRNLNMFGSTDYAHLNGIELDGGQSWSAYLAGNYLIAENMYISNGRASGITMGRSKFSRIRNVTIANTNGLGTGIMHFSSGGAVDDLEGTSFNHIKVMNTQSADASAGSGIALIKAKMTFTNVLVTSSDEYGMRFAQGERNTFSHATLTNNRVDGFFYVNSSNNRSTLNSFLSVNNGGDGLRLFTAGIFKLYNIFTFNNSGDGIELAGSSDNNSFKGVLASSNNGSLSCRENSSGSSPGFVNNTCADSYTQGSRSYASQGSDAKLYTGLDASYSFIGKVVSDDTENTSDSNGTATYSTGIDWLGFENFFRAWGQDGGAFPISSNDDDCNSGTCRIWDWSLSRTDSNLLDFNGRFVDKANCPASVDGNVAITDSAQVAWYAGTNAVEDNTDSVGNDNGICEPGENCNNVFLQHAYEDVFDGIGDDDGLCESGEACIYAPNPGAYQGSGDYSTQSCTFSDGIVSGVTMHAYPTNGE